MTTKELYQLAEQGFITDTSLIAVCEKNPELLSTIDFGTFCTQIVSPYDVEEVEYMLRSMIEAGLIKLSQDIQLENTISVEKELVVELNGKTMTAGLFGYDNDMIIEGDTESYGFWVKPGGKLTINGDGKVKTQPCSYSMAVWAQGGEVEINGGIYENAGPEGSDLIYASAGGKVIINGGEFKANKKDPSSPGTKESFSALNLKNNGKDGCSIVVYGGKFYGFDPANNVSEEPKQSFVAEGYESVRIGDGTGIYEGYGVYEVCKKKEKKEDVVVEPVEQPVEIVVEEKEEVKEEATTSKTKKA